jgi:hypothetical protein
MKTLENIIFNKTSFLKLSVIRKISVKNCDCVWDNLSKDVYNSSIRNWLGTIDYIRMAYARKHGGKYESEKVS